VTHLTQYTSLPKGCDRIAFNSTTPILDLYLIKEYRTFAYKADGLLSESEVLVWFDSSVADLLRSHELNSERSFNELARELKLLLASNDKIVLGTEVYESSYFKEIMNNENSDLLFTRDIYDSIHIGRLRNVHTRESADIYIELSEYPVIVKNKIHAIPKDSLFFAMTPVSIKVSPHSMGWTIERHSTLLAENVVMPSISFKQCRKQ